MTVPIIIFTWSGIAMEPLKRFQALCDKEFIVGASYPLLVHEARSHATHAHYFACVHDAWLNLPEDMAPHFPTEEHLRKYALIKAGYTDKRSFVCSSKAEAQRMATFITPMDTYALTTVSECTVTVYTAQSQSLRAMGKRTFQESKEKVLEILSLMVGTTVAALASNAGQAA